MEATIMGYIGYNIGACIGKMENSMETTISSILQYWDAGQDVHKGI